MPSNLTPEEVQQRTAVWFAMSRLWLNIELSDKALEDIAQVMVDSGYSLTTLRIICDSEIAPMINKKFNIDEWASYDAEWLAQQIIIEQAKPKRWQDALLDPLRRPFLHMTQASQWPTLIMKYQRIQRMKTRIEL